MNHGNVGYLGSDYDLELPRDVLRPISAANGSELVGVFYPPNKNHPPADGAMAVPYDLMLTPIPYVCWPRVARFTIRVKHKPGCYLRLSDIIDQRGGSIMHAEASRSAHRYDTWNLTLAFPDVDLVESAFDPENGWYKGTLMATEQLADAIANECEDIIFADATEAARKQGITYFVDTPLTYFYRRHDALVKANKESSESKLIRLVAVNGNKFISPDRSLQQVLRLVERECAEAGQPNVQLTPAHVFAEMDTKDVNLRCALIPVTTESKRFFCIQANWVVVAAQHAIDNSKGIMRDVIRRFQPDWNIWKIGVKTLAHHQGYEEGRLNFIVESPFGIIDVKDIEQSLNQSSDRGSELEGVTFACLTMDGLQRKLYRDRGTNSGADLVVSCASDNYSQGNKFVQYLKNEGYDAQGLWQIAGGENAYDRIAAAIGDSSLLFALVQEKLEIKGKSLGVRDEVMMAKALGKSVVPTAFGTHLDYEFAESPEYLKPYQGIQFRIKNKKPTRKSLIELQQALMRSGAWLRE